MKLKMIFLMLEKVLRKRFLEVLIGGLIISLISCQTKVGTDIPPDMLENKAIPTNDATDFETTYVDSGIVRYHLTTPRLLDFPEAKNPKKDPYTEFPQGFHLQEYDQNKQIVSGLSGNYGKYFTREKRWLATGNVVMVNNKGDTLRTEELNYLEKEDLIYTDKFVSIKKGDQFITGTGGFKSDSQMTKWSFMKTKGLIYMEEQ